MLARPMTPDDVADVNRLHRDVWWPERSAGGWQWLMDNPVARECDTPAGLVLDNDQGRPAAFLGIFVQRFWQGDRVLHGSTGFSVIVPPGVPGGTRYLIPAFLALGDMAARYTLNANALSSPIYKRFGMKAWPDETHDLKLSWVLDPAACLAARALRQLVAWQPSLARHLGERLMPRRSQLQQPGLVEGVIQVEDLSPGSAYDRFWQRLKAEGRFIADRSPQMLQWRMADPDLTRPMIHLATVRDGEFTGHALAMMAKYSSIEPPTLEIIDLEALSGHREAIPSLARALMAMAAPLGAAKLRLQVVSPRLLADLGELGARARREGGYGHCHVKFSDAGDVEASWQPTPYDGDFSLCLRPLPRPRQGPGQ